MLPSGSQQTPAPCWAAPGIPRHFWRHWGCPTRCCCNGRLAPWRARLLLLLVGIADGPSTSHHLKPCRGRSYCPCRHSTAAAGPPAAAHAKHHRGRAAGRRAACRAACGSVRPAAVCMRLAVAVVVCLKGPEEARGLPRGPLLLRALCHGRCCLLFLRVQLIWGTLVPHSTAGAAAACCRRGVLAGILLHQLLEERHAAQRVAEEAAMTKFQSLTGSKGAGERGQVQCLGVQGSSVLPSASMKSPTDTTFCNASKVPGHRAALHLAYCNPTAKPGCNASA